MSTKQQPLGTEQAKNGRDVFSFPNSPPSRMLAKMRRGRKAPEPDTFRTS